MKCTNCGCILSPTEEDDILQALVEGIKPTVLCEDCWNDDEDEYLQDSEIE